MSLERRKSESGPWLTVPVSSEPLGLRTVGSAFKLPIATPAKLVASADSSRVYCVENNYGTVKIINAETLTLSPQQIEVANTSTPSMALNPDETRMWVCDQDYGQMYIVDMQTLTPLGYQIPMGGQPVDVVIGADGTVYVSNYDLGIQVIQNEVLQTTVAAGTNPRGIALSPDGKTIVVANFGEMSVSLFDTETWQVTDTLTVDGAPTFVTFSEYWNILFVATANGLNWIDMLSKEVRGPLAPGVSFANLALTPNGRSLYLSTGSKVYVLDLPSWTIVDQLVLDGTTGSIAFLPNGHAGFCALPSDGLVEALVKVAWSSLGV